MLAELLSKRARMRVDAGEAARLVELIREGFEEHQQLLDELTRFGVLLCKQHFFGFSR